MIIDLAYETRDVLRFDTARHLHEQNYKGICMYVKVCIMKKYNWNYVYPVKLFMINMNEAIMICRSEDVT
jgi:hypothetical protein